MYPPEASAPMKTGRAPCCVLAPGLEWECGGHANAADHPGTREPTALAAGQGGAVYRVPAQLRNCQQSGGLERNAMDLP